jgi:adenylate cyclase
VNGPRSADRRAPDGPEPASAGIELDARALAAYADLASPRFDLADVARISGLDVEVLGSYWRALGFPEPREGEKLLTDDDVEMLATVVTQIADGSFEHEVALQMARVIGTSLDRIAAAQVDALLTRISRAPADSDAAQVERTLEMTSLMPQVLEFVWRRQLSAEARRRLLRSSTGGEDVQVCVGFADLVGFTAQTQQLDQASLARVVGRFEAIAYDAVARHGARVVKTIGDEVMFLADDVPTGAELALDLARSYRDDPDLSDVRVGLASGPVLERDGDIYGHTVNLASRIVSIAYPGSVVVSDEVHDALAEDEGFAFASLRHHNLKDIGRVLLWRLRRADDPFEGPYRAAREGRSARRSVLAARWRERDQDLRERAAGELVGSTPPERIEAMPERLARVLRGEAPPETVQSLVDAPTADELDALTEVVLAADLEPDLRMDLLTDIGVAQALRELDREADRKAAEADEEAERALRRIEEETARRVAEVEAEAQRKVAAVIARAEKASRKVDLEAARRLEKVVAEAHDKAERATREARTRAARQAQRSRRRSR